ncbi:MAG: hypothetical protein HQK89_02875 [Nitrospirae bacterium]|nr:hypothetical protein [Nitrospirota bacterium]
MKRIMALVLAIVMIAAFSSVAMAAGWEKCQGCHNDAGKPAIGKAKLLEKFKTADAFIKGAKDSKSPMMNAVKGNDENLKAAAADLGLK